MSTRAGVLALMLHSTYDHDMMEQLAKDVASKSESNSSTFSKSKESHEE